MSESTARAAIDAARFISAHATQQVRLHEIATHVGYSPFHLARLFEHELGQPPGQFLTGHRFQRAKQLLLSSNDRIIDICFEVGFDSVGTFTRRFRNEIGLSPTEFRQLPDRLSTRPPCPLHLPGPQVDGGVLTGTVELGARARAALGEAPATYVGLFPRFAARGHPVTGSLLPRPGPFTLTGIAPGIYWLLGTALPASDDAREQLVPRQHVLGSSSTAVRIDPEKPTQHRALELDTAPDWVAPVLIALPPLAVPEQQNRRRPTQAHRLD